MARARDALETWRSQTASEAKLTRALREGCSPAQLARAIQEAAAAGVKVAAAKRVLKLMQALDAAVTQAAAGGSAGPAAQSALRAKLEVAEQGGVSSLVLDAARRLLQQLQVAEARGALDAALKPHTDWSANHRVSVLKAALGKVEEVLGCDIAEVVGQQQQGDEQGGGEGEEGQAELQQQEHQGDRSFHGGHYVEHEAEDNEQQMPEDDSQQKQSTAAEVPTTPRAEAASRSSAGGSQAGHSTRPLQINVSSSNGGGPLACSSTGASSHGAAAAGGLSRAASIASSLTASEASSSLASLSAAASASGGGVSGGAGGSIGTRLGMVPGGGMDEQDLLESALRAWHLLQEDQRELERLGKAKAEQERLKKEMQEVRGGWEVHAATKGIAPMLWCWACSVLLCCMLPCTLLTVDALTGALEDAVHHS